jgi:AcrR family transcriptional regulator
MKAIPTQARAKQKRSALISAAKVCFVEQGYDNTTAKTIASRAGVATGTFYQYFENKEDILCVIAQQRIEDLYQQVPSTTEFMSISEQANTTKDIFHYVLKLIYAFHEAEPELHQVLEHRMTLDPQLAEILKQGEILLDERVLHFVRSFNIENAEAVAFNLFAMAEGLVHRHVFGKPDQSKETTLELGASMLASYFEHL